MDALHTEAVSMAESWKIVFFYSWQQVCGTIQQSLAEEVHTHQQRVLCFYQKCHPFKYVYKGHDCTNPEQFFMRMLLLHVPGVTSYENFGNVLESFFAVAMHPIANALMMPHNFRSKGSYEACLPPFVCTVNCLIHSSCVVI